MLDALLEALDLELANVRGGFEMSKPWKTIRKNIQAYF